jgi:predicted ABC-type ATPase
LDPYAAAIAAGREVLKRTADYLARGLSFAVETTLSSRGRVELIPKARFRGFETHLVFLGVDSPERCITRIRNRAVQGGHNIPDADVRRRYVRSMANAPQALRSVNIANYYDSSGEIPRLILAAASGVVVWQADPIPEWVKF